MELHQLKYFLAVAQTGNFTRAAERCHVAQASLSQQIIKLEQELGRPLFERLRRRSVLTAAGERLLTHASRILDEVHLATMELHQSDDEPGGKLTLGALPTIAPYFLPEVIERLKSIHPKIDPHLKEDTTQKLVEAIHRNEIELAITSFPVTGPHLSRIELFQEPLWLTLPKTHPLAGKRRPSWDEIKNQSFILMQEGHCLGQQTLQFCHEHDFQPRVTCQSAQIETVLALIRKEIGLSLVPDMARHHSNDNGLAFRKLEKPTPYRSIAVIYRNNRQLTTAAERTLAVIRSLGSNHRSPPKRKPKSPV